MDRLLHMNKTKWLLVFILGWWTIALFATGTVLPDSMVTEDKVYEYTFSDTPLAERIMAELRKQGKQVSYELDMTEGDLYYNTGRFIMATRFYKSALSARAVKQDATKKMKLLHRLISCYDGLYDEEEKSKTIRQLIHEAKLANDMGMESIALFYLGKSLHEQDSKERGYAYMLQASPNKTKS